MSQDGEGDWGGEPMMIETGSAFRMGVAPVGIASEGRHLSFHAVLGCHSFGICAVTLRPLRPLPANMTVSPAAR